LIPWTRRRILGTAVAAGGVALAPLGTGLAQDRAPALLRVSKQALVIGNSAYKDVPLKNPGNDAKGMAEALKAAGFEVASGIDLTQAAMRDLIQTYIERLAKTRAVGLFYFAGHGAQLAWRNYVVPTDASINNVEAIKERCIDINTLIEGIRNARNPMNVIVLDACRDNPFGRQVQPDQKGLSQLDAPPGTFLAYATAPGNTAIDGEGDNGLYTGHLLREMKVPEAKIEDVFKRVRLGVRRASKGLQVPWESTSLEEDFWFVPPSQLRKLAEAEKEREYSVEQAFWEKVRSASTPEPLEDYLRHYPSGRFTELAQLQLDRVLAKLGEKKIEIVSAPANPYSKGTARANTAFVVGDQYTYRMFDLFTKLESGTRGLTVTEIADDQVIFNNGTIATDLLGNLIRSNREREVSTARQYYVTEYNVGKKWTTRYFGTGFKGEKLFYEFDFKVVAREQKTVPAGTFDAFRVEGLGYSSSNSILRYVYWIAPAQVNRPIAIERLNRGSGGQAYISDGEELVSFRQQRPRT
jgi:hypothetical protein